MLKRLLSASIVGIGIAAFFGWLRWRKVRQHRSPAPLASSLILNPDTDISLRRDADTLCVEWTKPSIKAELFLSDATDEIDLSKAVVSVENQQFAMLSGIDIRKRYQVVVKLDDGTMLEQIERILPLESVPNFRDIGGYRTHDEHSVRWNRVYRSSALDNLSAQDSQQLQELGVRLVCDVRTEAEHHAYPDIVPDGIELLSTAPSSDDSRLLAVFRILFQEHFFENILLDIYQRVMIEDNPQVFARIFQKLGDEANLPIIIHCAVGKDRTGICIALLLSLLGVPDEIIVADYTLSNYYYEFSKASTRKTLEQLKVIGLSEVELDYLLIADARLMQSTLDTVRQQHGSIEEYLIHYVGLSAETLDAIRANLLV